MFWQQFSYLGAELFNGIIAGDMIATQKTLAKLGDKTKSFKIIRKLTRPFLPTDYPVDCHNDEGKTPLALASENGRLEVSASIFSVS